MTAEAERRVAGDHFSMGMLISRRTAASSQTKPMETGSGAAKTSGASGWLPRSAHLEEQRHHEDQRQQRRDFDGGAGHHQRARKHQQRPQRDGKGQQQRSSNAAAGRLATGQPYNNLLKGQYSDTHMASASMV
jgi:hypothetical protein